MKGLYAFMAATAVAIAACGGSGGMPAAGAGGEAGLATVELGPVDLRDIARYEDLTLDAAIPNPLDHEIVLSAPTGCCGLQFRSEADGSSFRTLRIPGRSAGKLKVRIVAHQPLGPQSAVARFALDGGGKRAYGQVRVLFRVVPAVEMAPKLLDFGDVAAGAELSRHTDVTFPEGCPAVALEAPTCVPGEFFTARWAPGSPKEPAPGQTLRLEVTFRPPAVTTEQYFATKVAIETNAIAMPKLFVPVSAVAVPRADAGQSGADR